MPVNKVGPDFQLPAGLGWDSPVYMVFGYKIVEYEGQPRWEPGTEVDYRNAESMRLAIAPEDVVIHKNCAPKWPGPSCPPNECLYKFCEGPYSPDGKYFYCSCD